ncbi:MAG: hypothetical protein PHT38_02530 [Halothiobacillus sp.]|jgi:hypothetical protein|nr:hypothetical protein [Halothiobacillus sp.]
MEIFFRFIRTAITYAWYNIIGPALAELLAYMFENPNINEDIRAVGQAMVAAAIINFMSMSNVGFWTDLALLLVGLFMIVRANRHR